MPSTRPRIELMSPMTAPAYASGTVISSVAIGSRMTGSAFSAAARKPMRAAVLNAISLLSTECIEPS